jgi:GDPmannose 4,6-dehydratase
MFGDPLDHPQDESTRFDPKSPYGIAKLAAHQLVGHYRTRYGLHASGAVSYNHESPRRSLDFVTRKVTHGVAQISAGRASGLTLGDLEARRDWGYAPEYVEAFWRMLQRDEPNDYVLSTGALHSVRELCEIAFTAAGLDWREHVTSDPSISWPSNSRPLVGNGAKAKRELGWAPTTSFEELIGEMVRRDLEAARR